MFWTFPYVQFCFFFSNFDCPVFGLVGVEKHTETTISPFFSQPLMATSNRVENASTYSN